jgi:mRNA interferase MazF
VSETLYIPPGYIPAQGDLVWLVLDPRVGREQSGNRPALVLSQKDFSAVTGYAMVAPITSRVRGWPFEVVLPDGLPVAGAILMDQSRSIDIAARHVRYAGQATEAVLDEALGKLGAIVSTGRKK